MSKVRQLVRASFFTGAIYRAAMVAEETGVSRFTARRALKALTRDGSLYERSPGVFVVTEFGPLSEGKW